MKKIIFLLLVALAIAALAFETNRTDRVVTPGITYFHLTQSDLNDAAVLWLRSKGVEPKGRKMHVIHSSYTYNNKPMVLSIGLDDLEGK